MKPVSVANAACSRSSAVTAQQPRRVYLHLRRVNTAQQQQLNKRQKKEAKTHTETEAALTCLQSLTPPEAARLLFAV